MSSLHSHHAPDVHKKKRSRDDAHDAAEERVEKKKKRKRDESVVDPADVPDEKKESKKHESVAEADSGAAESKEKKKKRRRDLAEDVSMPAETPPEPVADDGERKKKKKHRDPVVESSADISPEPVADDGAVVEKKKKTKQRDLELSVASEIPPQPVADDGAVGEKKKKKTKHRESAVEVSVAPELPLEPLADDGALVEKKKKKKHRDSAVEESMPTDGAVVEKKKRKHRDESNDGAQEAVEVPADVTPKKKRKPRDEVLEVVELPADVPPKKKKSKGKEKALGNYDLQSFISGDPLDTSLLPSLPFADMALDSNDDVLRAIQGLDITQFGTFDSAAPTSVSKKKSKPKKASTSSKLRLTTKSGQSATSGEYKKGKFSAYEVQQVTDAVESLQAAKGYTEQQIADLAMPGRGKSSELLDVVESALTNRSRKSVMNYVRRRFNPLSALGAWSAEEDAKLMQAIVFVGRDWVKVEQRVGRSRADCRDRYRNHLECPDRNTGPWSPEEEAELTRIVLKVTKGKNMDSNELLGDTILWSQVSKLMEGKRNQQQCRIKWLDTLSRKHKMGGEDREWSSDDTITLLEKLTQKDVMHDTEIDWKTLPDTKWNLWSPHMIQRHWLYLKKRTPGHENMTYPELLQILIATYCPVSEGDGDEKVADSDEEGAESQDSD